MLRRRTYTIAGAMWLTLVVSLGLAAVVIANEMSAGTPHPGPLPAPRGEGDRSRS